MRYYSHVILDGNGDDVVITCSEEEIKENYYPFWYSKMCDKFGKKHVDETYSFEECLEDWAIVNWAWPVEK